MSAVIPVHARHLNNTNEVTAPIEAVRFVNTRSISTWSARVCIFDNTSHTTTAWTSPLLQQHPRGQPAAVLVSRHTKNKTELLS